MVLVFRLMNFTWEVSPFIKLIATGIPALVVRYIVSEYLNSSTNAVSCSLCSRRPYCPMYIGPAAHRVLPSNTRSTVPISHDNSSRCTPGSAATKTHGGSQSGSVNNLARPGRTARCISDRQTACNPWAQMAFGKPQTEKTSSTESLLLAMVD